MASSDPSLRRLARQLVDVDQRLKNLETVPQLAHSSLDDQGLPVFDADGNLTVTLGRQPDGTWGAKPVAGPVPPQPVGVAAEGDAGVVRASWQGVFWAGAALPMDFEAVQVLVDGAVYAAIHDPEGGSVSVPAAPGERVISFRTLSQAGVVSEAVVFGPVTVDPKVSEQMLALGTDLSELRDVTLPELADDLDASASDLQDKLDAANARIDDIIVDGGGSGNFTTYSINTPTSDGTGAGDTWFRVVNGEVLGQWRWDGAAWQMVTLTDAVIAGIDLSKLVSNGNLSEVVASKMFTDLFNANKITSQEIAAGAITTEKISAEGIVADVIQGGQFTGESFEGGTFTGGLFKTSEDLPGKVELADDAYVTHLDGGGAFPGLRITPIDQSDMAMPAGIGPSVNGLTIYGGRSLGGGSSIVQANPGASFMRTFHEGGGAAGEIQTGHTESFMRAYREDGGIGGSMQTGPTESFMRTYREDGGIGGSMQTGPTASFMRTSREDGGTGGVIQASPNSSLMRTYSGDSSESGLIYARPQDAEISYVAPNNTYLSRVKADATEAFLYTRAGGADRYLSVDADGIWVRTNKSGSWKHYNLEETAQDSGWHNGTIQPGYSLQNNLVPKARKVGNAIYLSGGVAGAGIGANTSQHVLTLPAGFHPTKEWLYTMGSSSSGAASPLWVIKTNGEVLLRTAAVTGNYYMMDGISFLPD